MAWYWYVLIGVGVLVVVSLLWKGKSWWARQTPSGRRPPGASPSLTSEEAEKKRKEIKENLEKEESRVTSEADELRKKIEEKFGPRPEG